ncbi:hypothetical protein KIN20_024897, partial [Parelaphostrongylus tenuis]
GDFSECGAEVLLAQSVLRLLVVVVVVAVVVVAVVDGDVAVVAVVGADVVFVLMETTQSPKAR